MQEKIEDSNSMNSISNFSNFKLPTLLKKKEKNIISDVSHFN